MRMVRPSVNTIKEVLRSNIQAAYDVLYDSTDCLYPTIHLADYRFYIFYYLYYRILQYHMVFYSILQWRSVRIAFTAKPEIF
jgi:hypothetical protein